MDPGSIFKSILIDFCHCTVLLNNFSLLKIYPRISQLWVTVINGNFLQISDPINGPYWNGNILPAEVVCLIFPFSISSI